MIRMLMVDVYKRQMLKELPPTLIINAGHCPFKKDNETYGLRMAAMGTEVTIKCFMAVSYTHLDVYKRQVVDWMEQWLIECAVLRVR